MVNRARDRTQNTTMVPLCMTPWGITSKLATCGQLGRIGGTGLGLGSLQNRGRSRIKKEDGYSMIVLLVIDSLYCVALLSAPSSFFC